ncbi:unnamed protein product [Chrysoparadoxa australica]
MESSQIEEDSDPDYFYVEKARSRRVLTTAEEKEANEAFTLYDAEAIDALSLREVKMAIRALGAKVSKAEVGIMFEEIAGKHPGEKVNRAEFAKMVALHIDKRNTKEELIEVFKLIDGEGKGGINIRNLKRVAAELQLNYTEEQLQEMLDECDRDGDGLIGEFEFMKCVRRESDDPWADVVDDLEF